MDNKSQAKKKDDSNGDERKQSSGTDEDQDLLDNIDLDLDDAILLMDFQEVEDIEQEKGAKGSDTSAQQGSLMKHVKKIIKKVKSKKDDDANNTSLEKNSKANNKETTNASDDIKKATLEAQFKVTGLMVEELGNLGLDIKAIQGLINEAKKSLDKGDLEAAETLIKNAKIFASNIWLENRINFLSNIISFIETFILNITDLDLDLRKAKKYFKQARVFLEKRDLTLANKYIDNTIQNVKTGWENSRKEKLVNSTKYLHFCLTDVEELDLDFQKLKNMANKVNNDLNKDNYDKAEVDLKNVVDLTKKYINESNVDVNRKEDLIQEICGVYDFDNLFSLMETISKVESRLMESQEKDKIQLHLNSLLTVYNMILDSDSKGIDNDNTEKLFFKAKDSFEKTDYFTTDVILKKIMAILRKELAPESEETKETTKSEIKDIDPKEKQIATKKADVPDIFKLTKEQRAKLSPEKRELIERIQDSKMGIEFVKGYKKTGEDIVNTEELIDKAVKAVKKDDLTNAQDYANKAEDLISLLKMEILKEKAENAIEGSKAIITEAAELGVVVAEGIKFLESAETELNNKEYQKAIDIALHCQQDIESLRAKHQNASDSIFNIIMKINKELKEIVTPPKISELVENAEVALNNHDYDHIDKITKCITNQIKKLKAGEELDDVSAILGPPDKRKIADKETSPSKVPIAQEKPESEVEADKNLINNLKLALSKAINDLNTLLESGVNVSKVQEKIGNVDNFIKNNDPEEAENLLIQINKEIEDLKKPQTEDLEVTANNLMQKMMVKLSEAMNNELPVKEASDLINYAKQRMKRNSYGEVIEILEHSNDILEREIEENLKKKAEELLSTSSIMLKSLDPSHPKKAELNELWKNEKETFINKDFTGSIEINSQLLSLFNSIKSEPDIEDIEIPPESTEVIDDESVNETQITETNEPIETSSEIAPLKEGTQDIPESQSKDFVSNTDADESDLDLLDNSEINSEPMAQHDPEVNISEGVEEEIVEPIDDEINELLNEQVNDIGEELIEESYKQRFEKLKEVVETDIEENQVQDMDFAQPQDGTDESQELHVDDDRLTVAQKDKKEMVSKLDSSKSEELIKRAFGFIQKEERSRHDKVNAGGEADRIRQDEKTPPVDIGEHDDSEERSINDRSGVAQDTPPHHVEGGSIRGVAEQSNKPQRQRVHEHVRPESSEHYDDYNEPLPRERVYRDERSARARDNYPRSVETDNDNRYNENDEDEYYEPEEPVNERHRGNIPPPQQQVSIRSRTDRRSKTDVAQRFRDQYTRAPPKGRSTRGPTVTIDGSSRRGPGAGLRTGLGTRSGMRGEANVEDSRIDLDPQGVGDPGVHSKHKKRLSSLKKEALKGLQEIQGIIAATFHFGAQIEELERMSEDARNAFDDGDYQEVLLYIDKSEELSRLLKVAYMDSIISEQKYSGENTEYLEYLIDETENAYNEEKYKIGDELCRRFMKIVTDIQTESNGPRRSRRFCRHCGNTLEPNSTFCSVCGERLL